MKAEAAQQCMRVLCERRYKRINDQHRQAHPLRPNKQRLRLWQRQSMLLLMCLIGSAGAHQSPSAAAVRTPLTPL